MNEIKRYYKNGTVSEDFLVLYEKDDWILVKSKKHDEQKYPELGAYSFGLKREFHSLYFFPVNQSCLKKEQAIETLRRFIKINESYIPTLGEYTMEAIRRWEGMIEALEREVSA